MHRKDVFAAGAPLGESDKVLILLHGRGAIAQGMADLIDPLDAGEFTVLAPQATGNTWYPYSFLAPREENEPWLSSALNLLRGLTEEIERKGIPSNHIYLLGFSQGACLTLEYVARHAKRWGGVMAFTGGLIGDQLDPRNYAGDFQGTPVFIGTGDPDPHVPVERVHESAALLKEMQAQVTVQVYKNRPHTISADEIIHAKRLLSSQ